MATKTKRRKTSIRKYITNTLRGLDGIDGEVQAVSVTSVSDATQFLRRGMAITAAGDKGAIVCWKVGDVWSCEFIRHRLTADLSKFKSIAAVSQWLKAWWPAMNL